MPIMLLQCCAVKPHSLLAFREVGRHLIIRELAIVLAPD